jgi:hypothetical protein
MNAKTALAVLLSALALLACQGTKVTYMDDEAFLSPSAGNSPEESVTVNGRPCLDTDGGPGLYAVRAKSGSDLVVSLSGRPYAYQLDVTCSASVAFQGQYSAPAAQPLSFTIPAAAFSADKSFTCIGELHPQDRPEPVSTKFEFRASVVSSAYVPRESIQVLQRGGRWYAEPGKYSLHTFVLDGGTWRYYREVTSVTVSGPGVTVTSESRQGRKNLYRPVP